MPVRVEEKTLELPCSASCAFDKQCAQKYRENVCKKRISNYFEFIMTDITLENIGVREEKIIFTTTAPSGKGYISDGKMGYSGPGWKKIRLQF